MEEFGLRSDCERPRLVDCGAIELLGRTIRVLCIGSFEGLCLAEEALVWYVERGLSRPAIVFDISGSRKSLLFDAIVSEDIWPAAAGLSSPDRLGFISADFDSEYFASPN
jgi:hypothetical protein